MKNSSRLNWINAVGILLALFGFSFSPWLGARSGLALFFELGAFLRASPSGAQIGRQQAIFAILGAILFCLLVLTVAFAFKMRSGDRRFLLYELLFAALTLSLLMLLVVAYQAQTLGVIVTGSAALIAGLAAIITYFRGEPMSDPPANPALQSLPAAAPTARPALAAPRPQADTALPAADPMLAFQRQVAQRFHRSRDQGQPFTLGIVGIRYFDEVTNAFGPDAAQEMLDYLARFVDEAASDAISTTFSTGAMMVALPGRNMASAQSILTEVEERMVNHGFPGEMLLPAGRIYLDSFLVNSPDDGDNLARLTERVLFGYAETIALPYAQR